MSTPDPLLPADDPPVGLGAVDPPTPRFSAALTTGVLALVLLSGAGPLPGAPALGIVATALALAAALRTAAFRTAAFGVCLGCELPVRIALIRKNNHQQGATA